MVRAMEGRVGALCGGIAHSRLELRGGGGGVTDVCPKRGLILLPPPSPGRGESIRGPSNRLPNPAAACLGEGGPLAAPLLLQRLRGQDFTSQCTSSFWILLLGERRAGGVPHWPVAPALGLCLCRPETGSPRRQLPAERRRLSVRLPPRFPLRACGRPATSPRATPSPGRPPPEPAPAALTSAPLEPGAIPAGSRPHAAANVPAGARRPRLGGSSYRPSPPNAP